MPIVIGHDLGKSLVSNFRNQINFGGGFAELKAILEYAVALEDQVRNHGGQDRIPGVDYEPEDECYDEDEDDSYSVSHDLNDNDEGDINQQLAADPTPCGRTQPAQPLEAFLFILHDNRQYTVIAANLSDATDKLVTTHGTAVEADVVEVKRLGLVTT